LFLRVQNISCIHIAKPNFIVH